MLANSRAVALKYTKNPVLICRSQQPAEEVYWVPDNALPALKIGKCDPMDLVTPTELFKLKKKYKAPQSLITKIKKCYSSNSDEIEVGSDKISLEKELFIRDIEDIILRRIKQEYTNPSANFIPYYPREEMGTRCYHTQVVGSSSVGKSWTTAEILRKNFRDSAAIYIFSPTAKKDSSWTNLKKDIGNKVKLINSNEVDCPVPLSELLPGSVMVVDDIDATREPSKGFICALQSEALFHGRHHTDNDGIGMCVFSINHDAFAVGNQGLKSSNIESCRTICFPNLNRSVCTKYFQKRLHWSSKEIKSAYEFFTRKDRWCCIYSHVPNCIVTKHGVKLL